VNVKVKDLLIDDAVGEQLEGQILYENQKQIRSDLEYLAAPTVIATDLKVAENIGSVLRLADAAGCSRVIFLSDVEDQDLRKIKRTARSSDSFLVWDKQTYDEFFANEIQQLEPLIAVEITSKSTNIFEGHLPQSCTLVIGNERHGIPEAILQRCSRAVHIPMYGVNGSMNVTHALAIALFEWRRQHP